MVDGVLVVVVVVVVDGVLVVVPVVVFVVGLAWAATALHCGPTVTRELLEPVLEPRREARVHARRQRRVGALRAAQRLLGLRAVAGSRRVRDLLQRAVERAGLIGREQLRAVPAAARRADHGDRDGGREQGNRAQARHRH